MAHRLRFKKETIRVYFKKDSNRIAAVVDDLKNITTYYAKIKYDRKGNIIHYTDYLGNWYDVAYFSFSCPYNEFTVAEEYFSLPLARSVSARTLAMDLVSVEPMAQPTGMLFYMDHVYQPAVRVVENIDYEPMSSELFNNLVEEMAKHYNSPILHERV